VGIEIEDKKRIIKGCFRVDGMKTEERGIERWNLSQEMKEEGGAKR